MSTGTYDTERAGQGSERTHEEGVFKTRHTAGQTRKDVSLKGSRSRPSSSFRL